MLRGRPREAIELAELAVEEGLRVDEAEALTHAYTALDASYQLVGQPEKAVHEWQSLEIYTRLGHTRLLGITELNLGVQAYADGKWSDAIDLYRRADEDISRAGDRPNAALARTNLGEVLVSRGELDEAQRVLTDARRVLRSSGYVPFALFAETQLARCALERGEPDRAAELLERIADEAVRTGHAGILRELVIYRALAEQRAGRPEAGLAALESVVDSDAEEAALYAAPTQRARAACLAALGRTEEAREALGRALAAAEAQQLVYEQLLVRRALAELASGGDEEELRELGRLAQLLGIADSASPSS